MSDPKKDLTIIIVLYQERIELIKKCLEKIKNFKIIIIDNDNNLDLKNKISSEYKIYKYELNKKNIGFSKAANMAINMSDTKYILNINADCIIEENAILELLKINQKYNDCFITTPTFYNSNNEVIQNSATFSEKKIFPKWLKTKFDGDICVDWVLGSAILFEKEVMKDIGMFDENFFLFFLDEDICKRALNKKKSTIQLSNVSAIHVHGISKVKNRLKAIFLRNFNFTFDELYYFYKIKKHEKVYYSLKKKIPQYFIKTFLNILLLRLDKATIYVSKILAYNKFKKFIKN